MASSANPINPLLDSEQIAEIMRVAGAAILVTLAKLPGSDLFDKALTVVCLSDVSHIVTVNPALYFRSAKHLSAKSLH